MSARLSDLPDAPDAVQRFQHAYGAVSRAAILRELLTRGPATRGDLAASLDIAVPSVRKAITELIDAGYVTARLPAHSQAASQSHPYGTLYLASRALVMGDLAATMAWLSEERH